MSSTRKLSDKLKWDAESRAFELLDWETKPEDFDRLFERVITMLKERGRITRERAFSIMSEPELRQEVRRTAEQFEERFISLPFFIYMRLRGLVLPEAKRKRDIRDSGDET